MNLDTTVQCCVRGTLQGLCQHGVPHQPHRHEVTRIEREATAVSRLKGLQASRAIRQLPGRSEIPILAMSAQASDGKRERCLGASRHE